MTDEDAIEGATALTVDVYSSNQYKRLVYEGLRTISVDGANVGGAVSVGDRATLLRFFSVNLKTALDAIPRWTGQNRPFVDTSKPAISGERDRGR